MRGTRLVKARDRVLRAERDRMAATVCSILGGTLKEGGPVALREVDTRTGDERFLDLRGRELGSVRTAYRHGRPFLVWEVGTP